MANSEAILAPDQVPKSITQRVASNFGWAIFSEGIGRGAFFLANIYLARVLGVSGYGLFTLAQSVTLNFWVAVDLGVNLYGTREIARNKGQSADLINTLFSLRLIAGLLVFSIYSLSLFVINMPPQHRYVFLACGLYLPTYSFYSDWVAKGLEHFQYLALGSLVSASTFIIGLTILVHCEQDVALGALLWSMAFLFGGLALDYCLNRKVGHNFRLVLDFRKWLYHLRESIFYAISGGLNAFYLYLPIFLLSLFFSTHELGVFSASYRVILTLCSAGFLLPMAFYPIFSELYVTDKRKFYSNYRKFHRLMAGAGFLAAIFGTLFTKEIIHLLFGQGYLQSAGIFRLMVWMLPLSFIRYTYGSVLLATGYQRLQNIAGVLSVTVMLILGMVSVKLYCFWGPGLALLVTETTLVIILRFFSKSTFLRHRLISSD